MSLTSRVINLFSSGSTAAPAEDRTKFAIADNGGEEDVKFIVGKSLFGSQTMAKGDIEDEGRPPYLHVRFRVWGLQASY